MYQSLDSKFKHLFTTIDARVAESFNSKFAKADTLNKEEMSLIRQNISSLKKTKKEVSMQITDLVNGRAEDTERIATVVAIIEELSVQVRTTPEEEEAKSG